MHLTVLPSSHLYPQALPPHHPSPNTRSDPTSYNTNAYNMDIIHAHTYIDKDEDMPLLLCFLVSFCVPYSPLVEWCTYTFCKFAVFSYSLLLVITSARMKRGPLQIPQAFSRTTPWQVGENFESRQNDPL